MSKISDFSMLQILKSAGVETAQTGGNTVCNCPVCKPTKPLKRGEHNAQINDETLFCYSENKTYSRTEIIDLLNLRGGLGIPEWEYRPGQGKPLVTAVAEPEPAVHAEKPEPAQKQEKKIIKKTVYEHKDLDGKVLYKKERIDFRDGYGKAGKNIFYKEKPKDQAVVFYGLETLTDPENLNYIIFAEGEKCVESLRIALADTPGAGDTAVLGLVKASEWESIGKAAQDIILSKKIIIFQDNDAPGKKNTDELLKYFKKPVTVIDFNDKSKGYDIADWLLDEGTIAGAMKKYSKAIDFKDDLAKGSGGNDEFDKYLLTNLIQNKKPIISIRVMGLKIQYRGITGIIGATSAGKTDLALQLAEEHANANIDGNISLYLYYEGLPDEIAERIEKKKIKACDKIFAINNLTDFHYLEKFINAFRDKKILIITDYYQSFAWNLYINSNNKNAILREFTTQIFIEQNKLRVQYDNICFFNIYSLNNESIRDTKNNISVHPTALLAGAKEDGNIQYQLDYAYAILFSDTINGDYKLSRYNEYNKIRKYIKVASAKPSRIGIETGNPVYEWQDGRFCLIDENEPAAEYKYNNSNSVEEDIPWESV